MIFLIKDDDGIEFNNKKNKRKRDVIETEQEIETPVKSEA